MGDGANRVRAGVEGSAALLFCSLAVLDEMVRTDVRDKRMRQERHVYAAGCGRRSNENDMRAGAMSKDSPAPVLRWFVRLSGAECSAAPPISWHGVLGQTAFTRLNLPSKLRRWIVIMRKFAACAVQLFWIVVELLLPLSCTYPRDTQPSHAPQQQQTVNTLHGITQ